MRWIPISERKPTAEDADENGDVLWRYLSYHLHRENRRVTRTFDEHLAEYLRYVTVTGKWDAPIDGSYWVSIRDIELPPPPQPVMPERLEFVKCKPGEEGGVGAICVDDSTGKAFYAHHTDTPDYSINYTLYRRVSPGKRIVFEVGDFTNPQMGEWIIAEDKSCILTAAHSYNTSEPRTILRCVEGEEFLK